MSRYQVKFNWKGKIRFGLIDELSKEAKKYAMQGKLLIADAITPERFLVKNDANVVDIEMSMKGTMTPEGYYVGDDEYSKHIHEEMMKAFKLSESLPSGVHVGKMFTIGVADGHAYYVITKVNKSTCKIEWRGYCMDRYTDHHFGWGGSFPLKDVARYIEREEKIHELFNKRKKETSCVSNTGR